MNLLNTFLILVAVFVAVFSESAFGGLHRLLGAQIDWLPGLMVYTALSAELLTISLVALLGGLWLDSLSANPLGVSVLPLFAAGFMVQHFRHLILREQVFAQVTLGLAASAAVPAFTLLLLISFGTDPLMGWGTLWQWIVMALGGALATPVWFWIFDRVQRALHYRPLRETSFRADRQIKRSRR